MQQVERFTLQHLILWVLLVLKMLTQLVVFMVLINTHIQLIFQLQLVLLY